MGGLWTGVFAGAAALTVYVLRERKKRQPKGFAFMLLKEHPYGREMLRQLLAAGHKPAIVIQEDGGPRKPLKKNPNGPMRPSVATEEREKFLKRCEGHDIADTIEAQCAAHGIEVVDVPQHNKHDSAAALKRANPRLLVLGGTRIIRDKPCGVLSFCVDGCINAHPGLLPECRGSASPAWSVYHDIKIGSTCHFCTAGIDEGRILGKREIAVKRGYTYEDLCYYTLVMSGTLMTEAVGVWAEGGRAGLDAIAVAQGKSDHPTFRNAGPEILDVVHQKLRDQTYAHYAN